MSNRCIIWALAKCEAARKDTLTPNYKIIANFTADVKLFFKKQSAVRKRYDQKIVSTRNIPRLENLNYGKLSGFAFFDTQGDLVFGSNLGFS